jgi:hypothetical protein
MEGEILSDNANMLSLARKLGFTLRSIEDDPGVQKAVRVL